MFRSNILEIEAFVKDLAFDPAANVGTVPTGLNPLPLPKSGMMVDGGGGVTAEIGVLIVVLAPPPGVGILPPAVLIIENM